MIIRCSALRLPSTIVTINVRPLTVFLGLSSRKFNPSALTSKSAESLFLPMMNLGFVKLSSVGPSKNASSRDKGVVLSSANWMTALFNVSVVWLEMTFSPWGLL